MYTTQGGQTRLHSKNVNPDLANMPDALQVKIQAAQTKSDKPRNKKARESYWAKRGQLLEKRRLKYKKKKKDREGDGGGDPDPDNGAQVGQKFHEEGGEADEEELEDPANKDPATAPKLAAASPPVVVEAQQANAIPGASESKTPAPVIPRASDKVTFHKSPPPSPEPQSRKRRASPERATPAPKQKLTAKQKAARKQAETRSRLEERRKAAAAKAIARQKAARAQSVSAFGSSFGSRSSDRLASQVKKARQAKAVRTPYNVG